MLGGQGSMWFRTLFDHERFLGHNYIRLVEMNDTVMIIVMLIHV